MLYLSQRDPLWATHKIGASNLTLGKFGCVTCCVSMLSDYFKCYLSPLQIASNVNNYTKDGLIWWTHLNFEDMKFDWRGYNEDKGRIQQYLKDPKKAVILQVNNKQHWVVALRKSLIYDDYICLDPWTGKKCYAKKSYHNITGAAYFSAK